VIRCAVSLSSRHRIARPKYAWGCIDHHCGYARIHPSLQCSPAVCSGEDLRRIRFPPRSCPSCCETDKVRWPILVSGHPPDRLVAARTQLHCVRSPIHSHDCVVARVSIVRTCGCDDNGGLCLRHVWFVGLNHCHPPSEFTTLHLSLQTVSHPPDGERFRAVLDRLCIRDER
jgi:hypothetical protein